MKLRTGVVGGSEHPMLFKASTPAITTGGVDVTTDRLNRASGVTDVMSLGSSYIWY